MSQSYRTNLMIRLSVILYFFLFLNKFLSKWHLSANLSDPSLLQTHVTVLSATKPSFRPRGQAVAGERHHGYQAAICPGAAEHVAPLEQH